MLSWSSSAGRLTTRGGARATSLVSPKSRFSHRDNLFWRFCYQSLQWNRGVYQTAFSKDGHNSIFHSICSFSMWPWHSSHQGWSLCPCLWRRRACYMLVISRMQQKWHRMTSEAGLEKVRQLPPCLLSYRVKSPPTLRPLGCEWGCQPHRQAMYIGAPVDTWHGSNEPAVDSRPLSSDHPHSSSLPSWGPKHHEAETSHPHCVLANSCPADSVSVIQCLF